MVKKLSELSDAVLRQRIKALVRKSRTSKFDVGMIQLMHVQLDVNKIKRVIERECARMKA
jgi:hypothetical protein